LNRANAKFALTKTQSTTKKGNKKMDTLNFDDLSFIASSPLPSANECDYYGGKVDTHNDEYCIRKDPDVTDECVE
jgi:hypothetical protein